MSWSSYRVCLKLLAPLHAGWIRTGKYHQTRPYITGRMVWGALTVRLARDQYGGDYRATGRIVDNDLRFSYFYPSTDPDKVSEWPWDKPADYSWKFLGSYTSTAIASIASRSAEEGTLHETEHLLPRTREEEQVYLIGHIIAKENTGLHWIKALERMQLGGERCYGWGRIELNGKPVIRQEFFGYGVKQEDELFILEFPENTRILAHALVDNLKCRGVVEAFTGRETEGSRHHGTLVTKVEICWSPGGILEQDAQLEIQPRGTWKSTA